MIDRQPDGSVARAGDGEPEVSRTVTWLGHASVLLEMGGVRVLTDPALTHRVAHLRRHHHVDVPAIGTPDLVLISHVHMDHLHIPSLRLFGSDVRLLVPTGAASLLRRRGFRNVAETAAGRTTTVERLTIDTVPAVHSRRRGPHSRIAADAVGYILRASEGSVYFPGDTDLFPEMSSFDDVDLALLPIWGWGSTLGDGHLDPERAVGATELVQPRLVVPIHWGTYSPVAIRRAPPSWLDDPVRRFETALDSAGAGGMLRVLDPGAGLIVPSAASAPRSSVPVSSVPGSAALADARTSQSEDAP